MVVYSFWQEVARRRGFVEAYDALVRGYGLDEADAYTFVLGFLAEVFDLSEEALAIDEDLDIPLFPEDKWD